MSSDKVSRDINRIIRAAMESSERAGQLTRARQVQSYRHVKICDTLVSEAREIFSRCLLHDVDPEFVDTKIERVISAIVEKMISNGIPIADDLRVDYVPNMALVDNEYSNSTTENSSSPPSNNTTDYLTDEFNTGYHIENPSDTSRGEKEKSVRLDLSAGAGGLPGGAMQLHHQSTPAMTGARSDTKNPDTTNDQTKQIAPSGDQLDVSGFPRINFREEIDANINQRPTAKYEKRGGNHEQAQKWPENQPEGVAFGRKEQHVQSSRRLVNQKQETGQR